MANTDPILRFLLAAAAAGVLLVVFSAGSPALVPFLQAAFLIVILSQPVSWLCKKRLGAEFDSSLTEQVNLYGFVNWIGAGALDGTLDVEFGLRYFLTPWLEINGGYSYAGTKIVVHDPEGFARVQTNNIFFGATLGF